MSLVDYLEDSKYYYVINGMHKVQYGKQVLIIGLVLDTTVFVGLLIWLFKQNAAKKRLILKHTSLPHMNFSYHKEELEAYVVDKLPINQCTTISNDSLSLEQKVTLLITEIDNVLSKINGYIDNDYQIAMQEFQLKISHQYLCLVMNLMMRIKKCIFIKINLLHQMINFIY